MTLTSSPALRRTAGALLAAGALAASVATGASSASAAVAVGKSCPQQVAPCTLSFVHGSGGVRGTVDKSGTQLTLVPWTITVGSVVVCRGTYRPAEPATAISCPLVPPGRAVFSTPGLPGATRIALTV